MAVEFLVERAYNLKRFIFNLLKENRQPTPEEETVGLICSRYWSKARELGSQHLGSEPISPTSKQGPPSEGIPEGTSLETGRGPLDKPLSLFALEVPENRGIRELQVTCGKSWTRCPPRDRRSPARPHLMARSPEMDTAEAAVASVLV